MSEHTPGPWRVVLGPEANSHLEIHGGDGYVGLAFLGTFDDGSLGDANARLIAAAPDLLEVLKYILPSIAVPKAYTRAVEAIAKAEGK